MLLGLAFLHLASGGLCLFLERKVQTPSRRQPKTPRDVGLLREVFSSSYLLRLGSLVLLAATGASLLDWIFKAQAAHTYTQAHELVKFFAVYNAGIALLTTVVQTSAAQPVLERFGLGKAMSALPATLFAASSLALAAPGLLGASLARAAEAVVRGSLFRAGYEVSYTPVPVAQKRRVKSLIDVGFERAGDSLAGGLALLCLRLSPAHAPAEVFVLAAVVGLAALAVARLLDAAYVKALAGSLLSRAVELGPDEPLDFTTRSVLSMPGLAHTVAGHGHPLSETAAPGPVRTMLEDLRSGDPARVRRALQTADLSDPLLAAQAIRLLGRDAFAKEAIRRLTGSIDQVLERLSGLLVDPECDVLARRRIPRVLAAAGGRAVEALLRGLDDPRFEIRLQCARALRKVLETGCPDEETRARISLAVDRELSVGKVLWESHRMQQSDPEALGLECLDEVLRHKAHGSLEYVFTLLSLLHDRGPLMVAFRSLHTDDAHLRGTGLEFLEAILPVATREMLWDIIQEQPTQPAPREREEVLDELLRASPTIVMRLQQQQPHDLEGPGAPKGEP
jgi:hypothetical protein